MKLTVVSLFTPEIEEWARPVAQKKDRYCWRHGYGFVCFDDKIDHQRPASWSKIPAICTVMGQGADWVFWTDADSLIMRPDIPLETFITDDVDLIYTKGSGKNQINAGNFFIRHTDAALDFLEKVWDAEPYLIECPIWEQSRMNQILASGDHSIKTKCLPNWLFNSYVGEYVAGDFMCHLAGQKGKKRLVKGLLG